jgi:hypothetical protein
MTGMRLQPSLAWPMSSDQARDVGIGRSEGETVEAAELEADGAFELEGDRVAARAGALDEVENGDGGIVIPLS